MADEQLPVQTTNAGVPVESDRYSLTVGAGGPILLHDSYLIEQMAQWNRERIPERQPHAKGSGAFGRLEITKDVSAYTKAALLRTFDYLRKVDQSLGDRVEKGVRDGKS